LYPAFPAIESKEFHLMTPFRYAAIALTLVAGTGLAHAQTVITTQPPETRTVITHTPIQLTPTQRTTIYRTIMRNGVVKERVVTEGRAPGPTEIVVGARVPATAELAPFPQEVVTEVPMVQPYKYMVVNNRVWLVDPATSTVVGEVAE
jgi:hypothetical protein